MKKNISSRFHSRTGTESNRYGDGNFRRKNKKKKEIPGPVWLFDHFVCARLEKGSMAPTGGGGGGARGSVKCHGRRPECKRPARAAVFRWSNSYFILKSVPSSSSSSSSSFFSPVKPLETLRNPVEPLETL